MQELKGYFNPAVVTPVVVLNEIAIQEQLTMGGIGIRLKVTTMHVDASSACEVVVHFSNA